MIQAENTHLLQKGKYHSMTDCLLLLYQFGLDQKSKSNANLIQAQ